MDLNHAFNLHLRNVEKYIVKVFKIIKADLNILSAW